MKYLLEMVRPNVAIVTNIEGSYTYSNSGLEKIFEEMISQTYFEGLFDEVYYSCRLHDRKPNPSIFQKEAEKISPGLKDTQYLALALKLNCAIWSNDKKLKEQDKVKVYSTNELLQVLH